MTSPISLLQSAARKAVRVLIADDHPLVRRGLSDCLSHRGNLRIVGEATDGLEAIAQAKELLPDLVLMDIEMPNLDGLSAAEVIHRDIPQVKVVFISAHTPELYSERIIESGARGYIFKQATAATLVRAVEEVAAGGTWFDAETANAVLTRWVQTDHEHPQEITARERQVLVALTDGLKTSEIASRLGVSNRTVQTHREHIMRKLDIHNVAELTQFAVAKGLVVLPQLTPWCEHARA